MAIKTSPGTCVITFSMSGVGGTAASFSQGKAIDRSLYFLDITTNSGVIRAPMASFSLTSRNGAPSAISISIPYSDSIYTGISNSTSIGLTIVRTQYYTDNSSNSITVFSGSLSTIQVDRGATNSSIILTGSSVNLNKAVKAVFIKALQYTSIVGGKKRARFSPVNGLNPGDTVICGSYSIIAENISLSVTPTAEYMEVYESQNSDTPVDTSSVQVSNTGTAIMSSGDNVELLTVWNGLLTSVSGTLFKVEMSPILLAIKSAMSAITDTIALFGNIVTHNTSEFAPSNIISADAELNAISGLTSSADTVPYFTGSGTAALTTINSAIRAILASSTVAAFRTALGLGDAATLNVGTVAGTVAAGDAISAAITSIAAGNTAHSGRLTLQSGVPLPTSDQTAKTTVYLTPYNGNTSALWNPSTSKWEVKVFAEISIALGTITNNIGYDVFEYISGTGTAIEILAWTSNTARATSLEYQDGILVKTGDKSRKYRGSFLSTSTTTTEDSQAKPYLFNHYNQVSRLAIASNSTSHQYLTGAYRYWNNDSSVVKNIFLGEAQNIQISFTSGSITGWIQMEIDGTAIGKSEIGGTNASLATLLIYTLSAGYHYIKVKEYGPGAGPNPNFWNFTISVNSQA